MAGRLTGQFVLNVLNLFDQTRRPTVPRRDPREPSDRYPRKLLRGLRYPTAITTNNILRDPRFLQDSVWQTPREVRIGFKLMF